MEDSFNSRGHKTTNVANDVSIFIFEFYWRGLIKFTLDDKQSLLFPDLLNWHYVTFFFE